ncbi:MAG: DNA topoisomerase IB [Acidimicrobiales bacterium]
MTRLRHVDCSEPGWTRRRCGRGFVYFDEHDRRLETEAVARIRALAIPPAWTQVWICSRPNGHLQATGWDAAGRKQYLYHPAWRVQRDRDKFDHMLVFARSLPNLRTQVRGDLDSGDLTREQVLACAAHLLDIGFFRIGSEGYAEDNHTYGLATMLKSHVRVMGDTVVFDYPAKGSKRRVQSVVDPVVSTIVSRLKSRRGGGQELLAFRGPASGSRGRWIDVTSEDINDYLKAATGVACSAKDFRTWNATVLAAVALAVGAPAASPRTRARRVRAAVDEVAHYLGNTPAVARASYIDRRVIDRYLAGDAIVVPLSAFGRPTEPGGLCIQGPIEEAVLALLEDCQPPLAA